jgi:hypothetical protein
VVSPRCGYRRAAVVVLLGNALIGMLQKSRSDSHPIACVGRDRTDGAIAKEVWADRDAEFAKRVTAKMRPLTRETSGASSRANG